jgi:hypothetical protein
MAKGEPKADGALFAPYFWIGWKQKPRRRGRSNPSCFSQRASDTRRNDKFSVRSDVDSTNPLGYFCTQNNAIFLFGVF